MNRITLKQAALHPPIGDLQRVLTAWGRGRLGRCSLHESSVIIGISGKLLYAPETKPVRRAGFSAEAFFRS